MLLQSARTLGRQLFTRATQQFQTPYDAINHWSGIPPADDATFNRSAPRKSFADSAARAANMLRYTAEGIRNLRGQQIPHERRKLPSDPATWAQFKLLEAVFQWPFMFYYATTDWRTEGAENLYFALREANRLGLGVLIASEHHSLFDDPLTMQGLTKTLLLNIKNKRWLSTPCGANFFPTGNGIGDRTTRLLSIIAGMIPMWRRSKHNGTPPPVPNNVWEFLKTELDEQALNMIIAKAARADMPVEDYVERHKVSAETGISESAIASFNEGGMQKVTGNLVGGKIVLVFPKGTRDPDDVKPVKPGTGWAALMSNAIVVPINSAGMDRVMPINPQIPAWLDAAINLLPPKLHAIKKLKHLPVPFQTVSVVAGEPIFPEAFDDLRAQPPSMDVYLEASHRIYDAIRALKPRAGELHGRRRPASAIPTLEDGAMWLASAVESVERTVFPTSANAYDAWNARPRARAVG